MSKASKSYREMTADQCLQALAAMPHRQRQKEARVLLYKKARRPDDIGEQFDLLDGLTRDSTLTDFDRLFAMVAGGHKLSEQASPRSADWLDRMLTALEEVRATPLGYGLRRDRTHLVFSALNVMLNLDLATGARHGAQLAQIAFDEIAGLNPRRMTPYLFNTVCNVVKVVGLSILHDPEAAPLQAARCEKLASYAIEINNNEHWWVFSRLRAPRTVDDLKLRAAFRSFRNTMDRLRAIENAATSDPGARRAVLMRVAELCVGQKTPAQRAANMTGAAELLDRTRAEPEA